MEADKTALRCAVSLPFGLIVKFEIKYEDKNTIGVISSRIRRNVLRIRYCNDHLTILKIIATKFCSSIRSDTLE